MFSIYAKNIIVFWSLSDNLLVQILMKNRPWNICNSGDLSLWCEDWTNLCLSRGNGALGNVTRMCTDEDEELGILVVGWYKQIIVSENIWIPSNILIFSKLWWICKGFNFCFLCLLMSYLSNTFLKLNQASILIFDGMCFSCVFDANIFKCWNALLNISFELKLKHSSQSDHLHRDSSVLPNFLTNLVILVHLIVETVASRSYICL